jgi:demethylmenaquinone methyltransferase/2-methoxy-6-polyprenyl-1,4-benzoquinol methylase
MADASARGKAPDRSPHPPLVEYYAGASDRAGWVRRIFDSTAGDYDRIERLLGFGSGPWYRRWSLERAGLAKGMRMVDVGAGTGLVTKAALGILGHDADVTAVDPSPGMLEAANLPASVRTVEGVAEAIPLEAGAFDFLSMGFALRHVADLEGAFSEFHRILRPGGKVCVLEITRPKGRIALALLRAYMRGVIPALATVVGKHAETATLMRYYWDTIEACVPPAEVMAGLSRAGFSSVEREVSLGIFSSYTAVRGG